MNPDDSQPDLLRPRPTTLPGITVPELEQQCQDLRTLLMAMLVALLVLSLSLNLFLEKQKRLVRNKLPESRRTVQRTAAEYYKKEPQMRAFLNALQTFAASNRDFQPLLDRYRAAVPQFFVGPVPVSSAPRGLTVPAGAPSNPPPAQPSRPAGK